jgi:hypothetical protein
MWREGGGGGGGEGAKGTNKFKHRKYKLGLVALDI